MNFFLITADLDSADYLTELFCRTADIKKPTAPGVPRRSPIQVLSRPDDA